MKVVYKSCAAPFWQEEGGEGVCGWCGGGGGGVTAGSFIPKHCSRNMFRTFGKSEKASLDYRGNEFMGFSQ